MSSSSYPKQTVPTFVNLAAFPPLADPGSLATAMDTGILYEFMSATGAWTALANSTALGTVIGPVSSTANAVAVFADTTGKLLANSLATVEAIGLTTVPMLTIGAQPNPLSNYQRNGFTGTLSIYDAGGPLDYGVFAEASTLSYGLNATFLGFLKNTLAVAPGFLVGPGADGVVSDGDMVVGQFTGGAGSSSVRFGVAGGLDILKGGSLGLVGATSGSVKLHAAAVTTPYTLVMPQAQGGATTVLQNDGAGNLSWGAGGGGAPADHLNNAGNSGSTKTIDLSTGNGQQVTMTANCVFTLTNGTAGRSYVMYLLGGAGGFTIAVNGTTWLNSTGAAPGAITAGKVLLINFYCLDGTNYLGSFAGNY